jgi:hypothetical protein
MNSGHLEGDGAAAAKENLPVKAGRKQPPAVPKLNLSCLWLLGMVPLSASRPEPKSKNRAS